DHKGQRFDVALWRFHTRDNGNVSIADHFTHPKDFGFTVDHLRRHSECEPPTLAAGVKGRHQRRSLWRPPADLRLETRAAVKSLERRGSDLDDLNRRIPHQRSVGKYPEVPIKATGQCFLPGRLPILVRPPPINTKARGTRQLVPPFESCP